MKKKNQICQMRSVTQTIQLTKLFYIILQKLNLTHLFLNYQYNFNVLNCLLFDTLFPGFLNTNNLEYII